VDISTVVDGKLAIRRHIVRGAFDFTELKSYLGEIYGSPDLDPSMNVLWDLREADFSTVSRDEVQSVMEFVSKTWGTEGRSKAALVVKNDLDYGFSRMYQMMMEGATSSKVEVFRDLDAAETWIRTS